MTFLIADTFTESLARLTGDEQKAVKTTAFDLQMDSSAPGLSFHKLDKARDKRFWSVRVNSDIRPAEAAEAVLELATGGTPVLFTHEPSDSAVLADPFTHPDAQRRFRVVTSVDELERALDAPWEKWAVFLHPEQRQLVTRDYNGPARVAGSAGTGKTVVALHRAVHLVRTMPDARILLATFSEPLAHALIREHADRLLGPEVVDVDGNREDRRHAISVFNGPPPEIHTFSAAVEEAAAVGTWMNGLVSDGLQPHEIGVFVRSSEQVPRATAAVAAAGLLARVLDDRVDVKPGSVNIRTMHLAKGLEFRAVAVMACDDEVLPLQARIENVGDDGDLQEVYDTERQLLYVACTRAHDRLFVSAAEPASEFLDDVRG